MSTSPCSANHPIYEVVIGIEVHVQLCTKSKIFCSAPNLPDETPNKNIDVICTGQPGTLPVLNKQVLEYAVMAGLATECKINKYSEFARKHYFYPDLPKGYQITQADKPICSDGSVKIKDDEGKEKIIRIMRIHMEEDAGKNVHSDYGSYVDYNRAGAPLLEIVSYPDIRSSHEAKEYLQALHEIVVTLGICTGNMEEGVFRADTNLSVRKRGETKFGTRCELKNINSFKFISDAIDYEIERQINLLEEGNKVVQQTRLWDPKKKETYVMREKEDAADYRYFTDPDLPRLELTDQFIENIRSKMPELPAAKRTRLMQNYALSQYEAEVLTIDPYIAEYFEHAYHIQPSAQLKNWILRELLGFCKESKQELKTLIFGPAHMADLIKLLETGVITTKIAKDVFECCVLNGILPSEHVKTHNLAIAKISNQDLRQIAEQIIIAHPTQANEYKSGKEKLFGFFVGKVMAATRGAADPDEINRILKELL